MQRWAQQEAVEAFLEEEHELAVQRAAKRIRSAEPASPLPTLKPPTKPQKSPTKQRRSHRVVRPNVRLTPPAPPPALDTAAQLEAARVLLALDPAPAVHAQNRHLLDLLYDAVPQQQGVAEAVSALLQLGQEVGAVWGDWQQEGEEGDAMELA